MTTFTVTTLTDENDAGASVAAPGGTGLSLREAIKLANASAGADDITFAAGLSGGTIRLTLGTLQVTTAALTINGDLGNDGTPNITITGDALNNDVHQSGSSILTDINTSLATVVGSGNALSDNVKIIDSSQSLTLDGLILTGGYSSNNGGGGAVRVSNGIPVTLTVTDSIVSGNGVDFAPGGGLASSDDLIIDNSLISNNKTSQGGGGAISLGDATVTNSSFSGNVAGFSGGGIDTQGNLTVTNTTVVGNHSTFGGGGGLATGTFTGAVLNLKVINSTVTGNTASLGAGGVESQSGSTVELVNSIVIGNSGTQVSGSGGTVMTGGNIVGTNVFSGSTDIGDTSASQVFASISGGAGVLADNGGSVPTVALKLDFSNPALDASSASAPAIDVAGNARFDLPGIANTNGSAADLGALEATETPSLVVTTLSDVVNEFDGFTSLREAIAYANSNVNADASTPDVITFDASLDGTIRLAGATMLITESVSIDGDGRILISGDVANDDTTVGATDVTDIFATDFTRLDDNVRMLTAFADLTLKGLTLTGGGTIGDGGAVLSSVSLTLTDSTVSGNNARDGGGISADNVTLTNSTVSGNSAGFFGGGMLVSNVATLVNSTVSGNSAVVDGGGINALVLSPGTVNLTNSTVSGNEAGEDGGGIVANVVELTNSIVFGNDATAVAGDDEVSSATINKNGGNIVGTDVFQGSTDVGNTTLADVFGAVGANPHTGVQSGVLADNGGPVQTIALNLSVTNPALDASNASAPINDARGEARFDHAGIDNVNGSAADLGAYEAPELPSLVVTTLNDVVDDRDGLTSLREAVAYANSKANADADTPDVITFDASLNGTIRLDGGDGASGTVGGTLSITDAVSIDGDGRILITGDVAGDDVTVGATDITDIFATSGIGDNVQIINATAYLALDGLVLTGGATSDIGSGGAVSGATVTLTNSTVSGNKAGFAGGVSADNLNMTNSTVEGNTSRHLAGGIQVNHGEITNSAITGNKVTDPGSFGDAGGIYIHAGQIINTTIANNEAASQGGGIWAAGGEVTLNNTTITGNISVSTGGGILGEVTLKNSIVTGNHGATTDIFGGTHDRDFEGGLTVSGGNVIGGFVYQNGDVLSTTTAADVFAATADIGDGVLAGVLADNGGPVQTIALKAFVTNPALDASDNTAPTNDARGEARVDLADVANTNSGAADLGAYEMTAPLGFAIVGNAKANVINAIHTPAGQHLPGAGDDIISGRGGNDRISALGGDDTIIGGKGADLMRGGDGGDIFQFNSLAELKTIQIVREVIGSGRTAHIVTSQELLWDHIRDFVSADDQLDFANMDADRTTTGKQDFTLIGLSQFSGTAGELRFVNKASGAVVSGDLNGDGKADFKLLLDHATVASDDFILG